jgi:hypothetical protein
MKKNVGLYLGVNSVGVAVAQQKSISFLGTFGLSSLEEQNETTLGEDIRWEALINKALREAGGEGESIYVSLADRDFIFRSLEMPLMKKNEVESSLIYEIEKYIPFKIKELEWAYEMNRFPTEKKMNISFVGIKETNLSKVRDILLRLSAGTLVIEPSCLSLVRVVRSLKNFSKLRNFALLDLTETESYLTFFQQDLPVFNRYLTVPKKGDALDLNKFIESVDFSFQYFKREFKSYELERFIVAADVKDANLGSSLEESLQSKVELVSSYDITSRNNATLESVKAFGAATREQYATGFKPAFRKTALPAEQPAMGELVLEPIPPLSLGLFSLLILVGAVICFFVVGLMGNEVSMKKLELEKAEKELIIPKELQKLTWEKRAAALKDKENKVSNLKTLAGSFKDIGEVLGKLSQRSILPDGLWLENISINRQENTYRGTISGYIFRDNDYEERLGLDEFIANLKNDDSLRSIFSNMGIDSSKRQKMRDFEVTYFNISLR